MYKDAIRAAWAEINITNLDYNIKQIKDKVGPGKKITGIIKADAYGHGAIKVATVLRANGIESFGVATLSEAVRLRKAGFILEEIIVLGLTPDPYIDTIIEYRLTPVVCDYENAEAISRAAAKANIIINGYLAIDTGMGRIGYDTDNSSSIDDIRMIMNLPNFRIAGLFSHFAAADSLDKTYTTVQEQRFMVFYKKLLNAGIPIPCRTLANSAAIMEVASSHYEMVRPGIIMYGCVSVCGGRQEPDRSAPGDVDKSEYRSAEKSSRRKLDQLRPKIHDTPGQSHRNHPDRIFRWSPKTVLDKRQSHRKWRLCTDRRNHLHGSVHDRRDSRALSKAQR